MSCAVFINSRKLLAGLLAATLLATGCGGPADGGDSSASWAGDAATPLPADVSEGLGAAQSGPDVEPTAETTPASPTPHEAHSPPSPPSPTTSRTSSPAAPRTSSPTTPRTSSPPAQQPSPESLCGSGYYVINSHQLPGATTYLLYRNDGGYNCVVTIKTANVGTATRTGA